MTTKEFEIELKKGILERLGQNPDERIIFMKEEGENHPPFATDLFSTVRRKVYVILKEERNCDKLSHCGRPDRLDRRRIPKEIECD